MLRPLTGALAGAGVTANAITVASALGSIAIGVAAWLSDNRAAFLLIAIWFLARMALNAIDGMLAREFHQKSVVGGYLNEIGDVVSDAALYAPFALVAPFTPMAVVMVIVLSIISEFAGVLGPAAGASRRYDGPMGKSDRAAVFGVLAFWIGVSSPLPGELYWVMPAIASLLILTVVNRVRGGVREAYAATNRI